MAFKKYDDLKRFDTFIEPYEIMNIKNTYYSCTNVSDIWTQENELFIEIGLNNIEKSVIVVSDFIDEKIFKINYYSQKITQEKYDYITKNIIKQKVKYTEQENEIQIYLKDNYKIQIIKNKFNFILWRDKEVLFELYLRPGYEIFNGFSAIPLGFKKINDLEANPIISFKTQNYETYYGLGEKFDGLIRNNKSSRIWNADNSCVANQDISYNAIPLLYSSKGYGILLPTGYKTFFDIGKKYNDCLSIESTKSNLEAYVFYGKDLKELIKSYTYLTGRIKGVPTFAYGNWISRLYFYNDNEVKEQLQLAQENNFHVDVVNIDPKWIKNRVTKTCNFEYNEQSFGTITELKALLKSFKNKTNLCFWVNPYIQIDDSLTFKTAFKNGYLLTDENNDLVHAWTGTEVKQAKTAIVDFTNEKATRWWKEELKILLRQGLRVIKPDYGDGCGSEAMFNNNSNAKESKQLFSHLYIKAVYEAIEEIYGPKKAIIYRRPGYIGSHQYCGKWGGDSRTTFEEMRINLEAGLSACLSGEIMWGHDIGGFSFDSTQSGQEDLFVRWSQFGAFSTLTRWHGMGAREPWLLEKKQLPAILKYVNLKRSLIPTYKHYESEAIKYGWPIMRALALEFLNDKIARNITDQYLIGENILVCPVIENHAKNCQVYLPQGNWIDFDTNEIFKGNQQINVNVDINKMPIYIKENSCIIKYKDNVLDLNDSNEELNLEVWIYGKVQKQIFDFELQGQNIKFSIINNKIVEANTNINIVIKLDTSSND